MILSTLVTSKLHFEMCAGLYGHPVLYLTDLSQKLLSLRAFSYLCVEIAISARI